MQLLILSIGRDIVQSAEKQIGKQADAVIKVAELPPEDYPQLRQRVYQYFKEWQGDSIELILSGPVAFAFTLGQLTGLNHFDITVFQYDSSHRVYQVVPMPSRKEIT